MEIFTSDRKYAVSPIVESLQSTSSAFYRVAVGDNSLALVKAVQESCVLLLTDEGIPRLEAAEKLMAKAQTLEGKADLAEEVSTYAVELGSPDSSSALRKRPAS